jgi:ribosomal protein S18 acetylase RimI-like enzyme
LTPIVEQVTEVTDALVRGLRNLLPQLSPSAPDLSARDLREIVEAPNAVLFVARDPGDADAILGSVTLILYRIPSGRRARLESVVVDGGARGKGVGEALCKTAIARAKAAGVSALDLASARTRASAHRLYERLGFQKRDSDVYRLSFDA